MTSYIGVLDPSILDPGKLDRRVNRWNLCFTGIVVSALLLWHTLTIDVQSFFVDEVEELKYSHSGFWDVLYQADSMPPLFTILLRSWLWLFQSDSAGRWFSAVLTMTNVVFISVILNRRLPASATVATVLIAFSPLLFYYGQLIRGYSLLLFCVSVCIITWDRAIRHNTFWLWTAYSASLVLGMYTHYYFVIVPICLSITFVFNTLCTIRNNRLQKTSQAFFIRQFQSFSIASFTALLACIPLIPFLLIDFQYQHSLREPRPVTLSAAIYTDLSIYSGFALGASQREIHVGLVDSQITETGIWFASILICQISLFLLSWRRWKGDPLLPYLLGLTIIPLPLLALIGMISGITYNVRFVSWLVIPVSLLIARALESEMSDDWKRRLCSATMYLILVTVMTIANYNRVFVAKYQFEDIRAASKYINDHHEPASQVYVVSDYLNSALKYYLGSKGTVIELPEPGKHSKVFLSQQQADDTIRMIENNKLPKWIVYGRGFHGDPKSLFLNTIRKLPIEETQFTGIQVFRVIEKPDVETGLPSASAQ